jgi:hypothetical protein
MMKKNKSRDEWIKKSVQCFQEHLLLDDFSDATRKIFGKMVLSNGNSGELSVAGFAGVVESPNRVYILQDEICGAVPHLVSIEPFIYSYYVSTGDCILASDQFIESDDPLVKRSVFPDLRCQQLREKAEEFKRGEVYKEIQEQMKSSVDKDNPQKKVEAFTEYLDSGLNRLDGIDIVEKTKMERGILVVDTKELYSQFLGRTIGAYRLRIPSIQFNQHLCVYAKNLNAEKLNRSFYAAATKNGKLCFGEYVFDMEALVHRGDICGLVLALIIFLQTAGDNGAYESGTYWSKELDYHYKGISL